ncbi:MAG TPA: glycosyltransferase [Phycisphaerae bacterium]|nr:glycosyltransferase [Phycisphaerae bacterium]
MSGRRRLLILTRRRSGAAFRQRIEPYIAPLAERGIEADVAELAGTAWGRARQWAAGARYAGVLIQKKTLTAWDAAFLRGAGAVIYDFDDAIMYKAGAAERGPDRGRMRRFRRTVRRADRVIAGNAVLADHAAGAGAASVEVIPTGLDVSRYTAPVPREDPEVFRLVWIGSRSTLKQLAMRRSALEAIGRSRADIVLRVIADAPLSVEGLAVENVPWSLEAEAALLGSSDAGIAPMPDTPFTRGKCGFKVLQYMAAGLAVITSPVGVNAEYVQAGLTGLWARTDEEWVGAVGTLAGNGDLRRRLGAEGRRRVAAFDFAALADRFCDTVQSALDR